MERETGLDWPFLAVVCGHWGVTSGGIGILKFRKVQFGQINGAFFLASLARGKPN